MYQKYVKRLLDIVFSLFLLPLVALNILVCAILIKIDDGGPVFYCSKRLGKKRSVFVMYKLRTMKVNAPDIRNPDGSTLSSVDDPRLTRFGKTLRMLSVDELPQVINVLKGDMSFIGPRPDLPDHYNYYQGQEAKKLDVLPGISGYNQAYFRNATQWRQRLKNDAYYVEHISFLLDLQIMLKTIAIVLFRKGVFSGQDITDRHERIGQDGRSQARE